MEVADTTLIFDSTTKRDRYARAGVREYWILDLNGRPMIVHRIPVDGRYEQILTLTETDSAGPESRPDASVRVGELLPRSPSPLRPREIIKPWTTSSFS